MKKISGALFVEFAKGFDVIDYDLLCEKQVFINGIAEIHKLITSLTSRQQVECKNSSKSSALPVNYGVPLGSVLGPRLFSAYGNGLPLHIPELCQLFCDDTTIHTRVIKTYTMYLNPCKIV